MTGVRIESSISFSVRGTPVPEGNLRAFRNYVVQASSELERLCSTSERGTIVVEPAEDRWIVRFEERRVEQAPTAELSC
ncbi:MAG: hypothetical protein L0221_17660 [Chloroflexi bacterium]|nr:hypothetical protein [Chloroflexota bacterium]